MNNLFRYANEPDFFNPAVWLGSRDGARSYSGADDGHGFGSSVDNRDFVDFNLVMGNQLLNRDPDQKIWDRGEGNTVVQNVRVGVGALGPSPCGFFDTCAHLVVADGDCLGWGEATLRCEDGQVVAE